jgi:hypothetical protein
VATRFARALEGCPGQRKPWITAALRRWNLVICLHQYAPLSSWSPPFDPKAPSCKSGGARSWAISIRIFLETSAGHDDLGIAGAAGDGWLCNGFGGIDVTCFGIDSFYSVAAARTQPA